MTAFKIFINFTKEEKWLERMAEKGYRLKSASLGYYFTPAPPEKSTIRIDYRIFKKDKDFLDYCTLFEDSGWKHIAGTKNSGNQYFMKSAENGDDDIFSDSLSRAGRYKRMANMWLLLTILFFPIYTALLMSSELKMAAFLNPKSLYFTPGLWEMSGFDFWRRFLFETPFALGRGYGWILVIFIVISYFFCTIKAWILYKSTLNSNT